MNHACMHGMNKNWHSHAALVWGLLRLTPNLDRKELLGLHCACKAGAATVKLVVLPTIRPKTLE